MITLANPTPAKVEAEIARLTAINEEAEVRILHYRDEHANYTQTRNARDGVNLRNERIADLKALLK